MNELLTRVIAYTKTQRIQRLIEISVKGDQASQSEMFELGIIQGIREANGEIDEVRRMRQN